MTHFWYGRKKNNATPKLSYVPTLQQCIDHVYETFTGYIHHVNLQIVLNT